MKKIYQTPETQVFTMQAEQVIATSIPKDTSGETIGDGNEGDFDFAPKQNSDWTNN